MQSGGPRDPPYNARASGFAVDELYFPQAGELQMLWALMPWMGLLFALFAWIFEAPTGPANETTETTATTVERAMALIMEIPLCVRLWKRLSPRRRFRLGFVAGSRSS